MKYALCLSYAAFISISTTIANADTSTINGAGASFPYPIYVLWAHNYEQKTGIKINYQSIGSGAGIAQIKAGTTSFGASDIPLEKDDLEKNNLLQFPMIVGGIVPVINIPGLGEKKLNLTGPILVDIYSGKIKKWNDPRISSINSNITLPNLEIIPVWRSDISGTTWIFVNYFCAVSAEWKEKFGCNKGISWPIGIGGKGNEGVAVNVQKIAGSIGYVEFAYALQGKMKYAQLKNKAEVFINAGINTFTEATSNATWNSSNGFTTILANANGKNSWPIVGASYIIMKNIKENDEVNAKLLEFFDWAYTQGSEQAISLQYTPIPMKTVPIIRDTWKTYFKNLTGKLAWLK